MDNGYMQEIRARILAAEDGAVFVAPDFADIADACSRTSANEGEKTFTERKALPFRTFIIPIPV